MGLYWVFLVCVITYLVYAWVTNTFQPYYWEIVYVLIGFTILIKLFF